MSQAADLYALASRIRVDGIKVFGVDMPMADFQAMHSTDVRDVADANYIDNDKDVRIAGKDLVAACQVMLSWMVTGRRAPGMVVPVERLQKQRDAFFLCLEQLNHAIEEYRTITS